MWELSQNIGYENKMIGVSLGIACAHLIEYERGTQQEFNLKVCVTFYLLSLCSKQIKGISSIQTEKQIRYSWNRVFDLKSKMYWVSAVLNWVFVKFILGNTTFPPVFYIQGQLF